MNVLLGHCQHGKEDRHAKEYEEAQVKDLPRPKQKLTAKAAKEVKGGLTPAEKEQIRKAQRELEAMKQDL